MRLRTSLNSWSCLPTSIATLLDIPVSRVIETIGHDGSAQYYLPDCDFRVGFHTQECIDALESFGRAATPIEVDPQYQPADYLPPIHLRLNENRLLLHLHDNEGFITGFGMKDTSRIGHAVAWDGEYIYDCRSNTEGVYPFTRCLRNNFYPTCFWKVRKI